MIVWRVRQMNMSVDVILSCVRQMHTSVDVILSCVRQMRMPVDVCMPVDVILSYAHDRRAM